ncbi:MAG: hypothetical protein KDA20_08785 [Phycisphaerales bacterium]|nr:hypothetical protein [Phycisphaerales bacterium]
MKKCDCENNEPIAPSLRARLLKALLFAPATLVYYTPALLLVSYINSFDYDEAGWLLIPAILAPTWAFPFWISSATWPHAASGLGWRVNLSALAICIAIDALWITVRSRRST